MSATGGGCPPAPRCPILNQRYKIYIYLDLETSVTATETGFKTQSSNLLLRSGFFLTLAAEKTKTQGQNSSKKLKEKTQPLGATMLKLKKLKKKTHLLAKFLWVPLNMQFLLPNIFNKGKIFKIF